MWVAQSATFSDCDPKLHQNFVKSLLQFRKLPNAVSHSPRCGLSLGAREVVAEALEEGGAVWLDVRSYMVVEFAEEKHR